MQQPEPKPPPQPFTPLWIPEPDAPQPRKRGEFARSFRRHQRDRRLAAVTRRAVALQTCADPIYLRILVDTRTTCSCGICKANGQHADRARRAEERRDLAERIADVCEVSS